MRAEWKREDARRKANNQRATALDAAEKAIREIAAGHNDPRTLALKVLSLFPAEAAE